MDLTVHSIPTGARSQTLRPPPPPSGAHPRQAVGPLHQHVTGFLRHVGMSGLGCIVFNGMIAFLGIAALCVLFAVGLAISGNAAALTDRGLATVIFAATGAFSSFVGLFTACKSRMFATQTPCQTCPANHITQSSRRA